MGLAVAQVRLLALTNRKADIECQLQINSKRKMMLTRKSTELAQQYYSRLQCANIQYATSSGYEDVTFDYLMGQTSNGLFDPTFLQQVAINDPKCVKKAENSMILTDFNGTVVVNNSVARLIEEAKDSYIGVEEQTCQAILNLVEEYKSCAVAGTSMSDGGGALRAISAMYYDASGINEAAREKVVGCMKLFIQNNGCMEGGIIYQEGSKYYPSAQDARNGVNAIVPQAGYRYEIRDKNEGPVKTSAICDKSRNMVDFDAMGMKYLGNLVSYLAPIISSGIFNGTTTTINKTEKGSAYDAGGGTAVAFDNSKCVIKPAGSAITVTQVKTALANQGITITDGKVYRIRVKESPTTSQCDFVYYKAIGNGPSANMKQVRATNYYEYEVLDNKIFTSAQNTEVLQNGFRTGTFQLAKVADIGKGLYHKNTTMDFFTHMNYVVEKTDSSKREEITAWFNAQQADVSAQETYWDTEIQNLSTELSSVNTEIQAVKQLKSDNIKSVFAWGNS